MAQERMLGMDYNIDATKAMLENLPEYMKKQPPKEMPDNDFFSRFMINFGLNLGTTSPRGNLLTTALAAAQGPTKEYFERQDARDLMERQDEQMKEKDNLIYLKLCCLVMLIFQKQNMMQ